MLFLAENSEITKLYLYLPGDPFVGYYSIPVLMSFFFQFLIYSQAKVITKFKEKRKPKAYFHFWAFHLFALLFMSFIALSYRHNTSFPIVSFSIVLLAVGIMVSIAYNVETPNHCCRCSRYLFCFSHFSLIFISVCLLTTFTTYFIFSIPTIFLVYYLYPIRTLIRLPLIINAVIYINSLLALLLFQCERFWYPCVWHCTARNLSLTCHWSCHTPICCRRRGTHGTTAHELRKEAQDNQQEHSNRLTQCVRTIWDHWKSVLTESIPPKERVENHDQYYHGYKYQNFNYMLFLVQIIVTFAILIVLMVFVYIIYELQNLHTPQSSNSNLTLLLTIVPSLVLLFGSWYRLDIFFDIEKEKSQKEILQEILQVFKKSAPTPPESLDSLPEQPAGVSIQDQPSDGASIQDQPAAGAFIQDQPGAGASIQDQPAGGASIQDQPAAGVSIQGQPGAGASIQDQPAAGASIQDQPAAGVSIQGQPAGGTSIQDQPAAGASIQDQPAGVSIQDQPAAGASIQDQPAAGASIQDQPAAGASIQGQPAAGASIQGQPAAGASIQDQTPKSHPSVCVQV